jgi:hypothetical protein
MRKLFVILAVVALAVTFTAPAKAEVSFYGHILMLTYILDSSADYNNFNNGWNFSDSDTVWRMDDGDSRFGARFKSGDFSANVEIRPRSDALERQWNASWNFGTGTLSIGHMWSPEFSCITGAAYVPGILGGYGDPGCTVRADMVKLTMGALQVALVEPYDARAPVTGFGDTDTSLPKIVASYTLNVGPAAIKAFGGYQTYEEVNTATDSGVSIDSYVVGVNASAAFGPAYVKAMYWVGQNEATYAPPPYPVATANGPDYTGTTLTDADNSAYAAVVGYHISETMTIEAGYEASKYECDAGAVREDTNSAYYVTLPIKVGTNMTVTPEFLFLDDEDYKNAAGTEIKQGDRTIYGVAWKITF